MYVILGGTGNTGKRIAEALLAAGKEVTIVSRDAGKAQSLVEKGANVAIGDLHDSAFLTQTFKGAKAVYTLIPPKWDVTDWRAYQVELATSIALALHVNRVPYVVNLSSLGAQMPEGAGPVSGLYYLEQVLNKLPGLNVVHLRAGYFYHNLFGSLDTIVQLGILAQPLAASFPLSFVHPADIAEAAIQQLLSLDFKGHSVQFVTGPREYTFGEVASLISKVGGKEVPFVQSTVEQAVEGMIGAGIPAAIAHGYGDMYQSIAAGHFSEDLDLKTSQYFGKISLEQFIENEFKYALSPEVVA